MAKQLRLEANDILVKLAGVPVKAPAEVGRALRTVLPGEKLTAEVRRGEQTLTLEAAMQSRPFVKEDGMTVVYDQVKVGDRRIRVIFTHPEGKGPFKTVFLIGGIGAYSVDAPFASAPYGTILGPLAKAGYAIVRVEKPGQGDSEGPAYPEVLFEDELAGYIAGLRLAKTMPFIDKDRIAIFGHSMGGTFGPLAAAQEPVAGLAVGGTLARTWFEYQIENTRRQIMLGGTSAAAADQFMRPVAAINHLLFNEQMSVAEIREKRPDLAPFLAQLSPDGKTMSGVGIPFFQQLAKRNLGEAWAKVNVPTLVLYGANDFVSSEEDHLLIRNIVNQRKEGLAEYVRLANSDHGFFQTESPADSMRRWGQPGGTFNPNVVDTLKAWLEKTLG